MNRLKPLKQVSEAVRERETFKYDPSLLNTATFNHSGRPIASSLLFSCDDTILTALAQLGAWQTGTERSLISLFDANYQYTVAEATTSQSLQPSVPSDSCQEPLWLCGTAIPRSHGVCDLALLGDASETGGPPQLPLTLSQDLTADARFRSKPYCQPGGLARFYAAVPIRTQRGINIGVYCVVNAAPGKDWTDYHTRQLREVSENIMMHLEMRRSTDLCRRNERMNRGLGSFIEGKSTMSGWRLGPNIAAFMDKPDHEGALNPKQQFIQRNGDGATANRASIADVDPCPHQLIPQSNNIASTTDDSYAEDRVTGSDDETPMGIFSKAANIIRESIEVEGCLFFDATMGSYRSSSLFHPADEAQNQSSSTSSSEENLEVERQSPTTCQLLGFSTSASSSVDGTSSRQPGASVAEKFLTKLLRRYPKGMIFNFSHDGELEPSYSSEDDVPVSSSSSTTGTGSLQRSGATSPSSRAKKPWARQHEGSILLKAFPGARSVAFVPIWDPRKERWYAGGFIYTNNPARILTLQGELSYLRAFGTLAIADILRFNTLLSDRAKSDALGSLSHELRSPLHGVLLSAELLMDTDLDVFQGNATHTISTCSRTLLDTIDHLLDYAKVNHLAGKNSAVKGGERARSAAKGVNWEHFGRKSLVCISRLDGLAEEVVESVFAGFNFQHLSGRQSSRRRMSSPGGGVGTQNPGLGDDQESQQAFREVLILLSFDQTCNWTYNLQVGAFRRIVMNIFGNALKYTPSGRVELSLTQDVVAMKGKKNTHVVKLTVQDTGKGIGPEYLKQKLFKPFSQEDDLAPGTGLGLSLVKQITTQLGGHISVDSQVGIGTKVTVTLPLEQVTPSPESVSSLSESDRDFEERCRDLKGLRVQIIFPACSEGSNPDCHKGKLTSICTDWLQMEVVSESQAAMWRPDLVLWSYDALPADFERVRKLEETPNLVICSNPLEAYRQSVSFESAGQAGIFEFLSQPIGPRKLAKTLMLAYRRWMGLPKAFTGRILALSQSISSPDLLSKAHVYGGEPHQASSTTRLDGATRTGTNGFAKRSSENNDNSSLRFTADSAQGDMSPGQDTSNSPLQTPLLPDPPRKLLLVDDNKINLKVLSSYMKKLGIEYSTAGNGQEAVDHFVKSPRDYKCILMDVSMPIMDGFEATRRIRAYESQEGCEPVSIVALSGLASEDAQREAFGCGMDSFLTKPAKLKVVEDMLKSQGLINSQGSPKRMKFE